MDVVTGWPMTLRKIKEIKGRGPVMRWVESGKNKTGPKMCFNSITPAVSGWCTTSTQYRLYLDLIINRQKVMIKCHFHRRNSVQLLLAFISPWEAIT